MMGEGVFAGRDPGGVVGRVQKELRLMRCAGLLVFLCLLSAGCAHSGRHSGTPSLDVMTFNLRFASETPPNAWSGRRPVMRELLRRESPDLIATQEGVYAQLSDIETDLPDHAWIGLGRDGGSRGEFMAVFYRRDRLVPLEYDHFWLSDTPEAMGSRSWGNRYNRMVTWVRFLDRQTGCQFYAVDTHFDHEAQAAREKSAELLLSRAGRFDPGLPVLLLGDFNAAAGNNPVYERLTSPGAFADTWRAVHGAEPEIGTFHDFRGIDGAQGAARIDWILYRGAVQVQDARIITFERGGQYPSDHFPSSARVTLDRCR